ncbi:hypothetical protein G6F31_020468 [Rhizopus arrhizus]|nr:hypothetical protein G6F31_020468 [Rhizopus arrhizus]
MTSCRPGNTAGSRITSARNAAGLAQRYCRLALKPAWRCCPAAGAAVVASKPSALASLLASRQCAAVGSVTQLPLFSTAVARASDARSAALAGGRSKSRMPIPGACRASSRTP